MSVVVTGATGKLGRRVVESLLERGTPASEIAAVGRSVDRIADLRARGVAVVAADYRDGASLDAAFAGADKVLLVSSSDFNDRAGQHRTAIAAATRAGASHIVYTSAPYATTTSMLLAADHRATEEAIAASGLPSTILRNGWYVENYTSRLQTYLQHGIVGAAGDGRVSVALRSELADAAAAVLAGEGHEGKVYELGGEAITFTELAALLSAEAGQDISYTDVPLATLTEILVGAGVPQSEAVVYADIDRAISAGELTVDPKDLETLLGRPVTPAPEAIKIAVAAA